jgi:hypothetical protein
LRVARGLLAGFYDARKRICFSPAETSDQFLEVLMTA